jgi:hypothetical protein
MLLDAERRRPTTELGGGRVLGGGNGELDGGLVGPGV